MSDNNDTTNHNLTDGLIQAVADSPQSEEDDDWSAPLWDDNWDGDVGDFSGARLCVATKKWGDGTVDVLIAHYPDDEDSMPTAYAHRHGNEVAPLTVHGPADEVVETVTQQWREPQMEQASGVPD
jgi:hypothetical protein